MALDARRLRYGMVGGGVGAFIGDVHRRAIALDDSAELVAGCFSRDPQKNASTGLAWRVPDERVYRDFESMAAGEAVRDDAIDFVVIVSPNDTHHRIAKTFLGHGIHVACDKPLTTTVADADELVARAAKQGRKILVTYPNVGYPIVKHARQMIAAGEIGRVRMVMAEYPQGWQAPGAVESNPVVTDRSQLRWRMNPETQGPSGSVGDIGTHAENLVSYVTGLEVESVSASLQAFGPNAVIDNNATINARLSGDAIGHFWTSQIAIGYRNALRIRVVGEKGTIEWCGETPDLLGFTQLGGPTMTLSKGSSDLHPLAQAFRRIPPGHPEGTYEGFSNIYRAFVADLRFCAGVPAPGALAAAGAREPDSNLEELVRNDYPTGSEAARSVRFIHAAVESSAANARWVRFAEV